MAVSPSQAKSHTASSSACRVNVMPGGRGEVLEQVELLPRQMDVTAAGEHGAPAAIDLQVAEREQRGRRRVGSVRRRTARTRAITSRGENGFVT